MLGLIARGMGFGFTATSTPGPLQSFIISTTLSKGWRKGLIIVFAPLLTDAPIIIVMAFLLRELPPDVVRVIQIAGGLFVMWLAWSTWQALKAGTLIGKEADEDVPGESRRILMQSITMNYLSPGPYIFWGSVTGPILIKAVDTSVAHMIVFLFSFYATFIGSMSVMVFVFDRMRKLDERVTYWILVGTIVVLAGLGFSLLANGVMG